MPETGAARLVVRPRYGGFKPRSCCLFGLGSVWLYLSFSVSVGYTPMVVCCGVGQLAIWWRHLSAIIPGGAIGLINDGLFCDMIRPLPDICLFCHKECACWPSGGAFPHLTCLRGLGDSFNFGAFLFCGKYFLYDIGMEIGIVDWSCFIYSWKLIGVILALV